MTALLHALLVGGSHDEAFALACVLALAIVLRALARAVLRQNVIRVTKHNNQVRTHLSLGKDAPKFRRPS